MHKNCWKENSDLSRCSYSFPNAKIHQHPRKEQAAEQFPVYTSRIANAICNLQHVVSAESEQRKYTSIRAQLTLLPKGHVPAGPRALVGRLLRTKLQFCRTPIHSGRTPIHSGRTNSCINFNSLGSDKMSDGFLATSENFTNGSDNVRDRPIF